ncbi:UTRA domain-containing protein [Micromonospora sp. NPDC005172]|uniref:UTRA domain-containing protein n=1 Tax=Micromonospora sp. NPDC005172 TaxID=3156867 RepID=UPI0033A6741D
MSDLEWISVSTPYVTPRRPGEAEAWGAEAAQNGGVGTQRLLDVSEIVPAAELAYALHLDADAPVIQRRRMMLLDGQPVELATSLYPATIARDTGLAELRKIRGGAVTLLAELGYRPRRVSEDVYTRRATEVERSLLQLREDDWVLGLTRVLSTDDGLPVELSVMTMTPGGRRLRYESSMA